MTTKLVGDKSARHRAARLSPRTFAAVTQFLPVGIGVVDQDGRFVSLNDRGLQIYGLDSVLDGPESLEDYAVMFPLHSLDGRLLAEHERPIARALRGEAVVGQEVLMRRLGDDAERVLSFSAELLPGRESRLVAFVVLDITERMQATQELIRAHGLIRGITHGTEDLIAAEDLQYRYVFFNEAYRQEFRQLWGRELEQGTNMLEVLAAWPEEQAKARALWQRALNGESFSITTDFGRGDKNRQVYDLRFNPIHDENGELIGAAHILRNVTQREQIQEALERSEEALRENDRRKDEFLATLAHELRNPLAPVRSGIELLRRRTDADDVLDMMDRQMAHLVRLVDDLLDVSRVSRGKIKLNREALRVGDVVGSAREATEALLDPGERVVTVDVAPDLPMIDADFTRAVQIVSNLFSNALKFTEGNGHIHVAARLDGHRLRISVRDNGAGIAPERLAHVFELFNQGDVVQGGGLGIGLTLVRSLAEQHGGRVAAFSDGPGRGSEFAVWLPLAAAGAAERTALPVHDGRRLDGQRILVVDDNRDAATALTLLLDSFGAESRRAADGAGALNAFETFGPDTVLLDIGLPDISGHEVARRMRARDPARRVRLVAVTGWSREEVRRRDEDTAFDRHLVKPVRIDTLLQLLDEQRNEPDRD